MKALSVSLGVCGTLASLASANREYPPRTQNDDGLATWLNSRAGDANMTSALSARDLYESSPVIPPSVLFARQEPPGEGALLCSNGECVDGSCCSKNGVCGYGEEFCGDGCKSNCDATAMCGEFSAGGNITCGLDLCCSWGGWCGTSDVHCIGPNKWAPCQEGYGSCEIKRPQTCGEDSGTSNQRMIGYYQASNFRDRACNRIYPKDIKYEGYTHLLWAFASIDPQTYRIKPREEADKQYMREFTSLKGKGRNLQPWVAVGGYDFSDPDTETHTTWHDLCADEGRRTAFIQSALEFMDEYGFDGIDLDWEYPGEPKRGGDRDDIANFVLLLQEMKAAYGSSKGISLTLAPDYWYLRYFDVKALEPYVDHFGFMSYDLHGYWDTDVKALGSIVRGQADLREIRNNTLPLAYAEVDPSKIVFGVAYYGRGYTISDPSCNTFGCPFSGPNKPGKCTNSAGVLSLVEIQQMIANGEATSRLNPEAAMKELRWADQWVSYDDEETIAIKKKFANDQCFGGIMAWSVDFNSGTGGDEAPSVSTDGKCGPANKGATCTGSGFGDCCSSTGWCGSSLDHCGTDCISGDCVVRGKSTNGRCGAGFHYALCAKSDFGKCCSAGGWCGDSDAHCGDGCQNGACGSQFEVPNEGNVGGDGNGKGSDEWDVDPDEEEGVYPDNVEELNKIGTRLSGFYGCDKQWQSDMIKEAYLDANRLVSQAKVQNIQFDHEIAEDFFGPRSGISVTERQQIQSVFRNVATVSPGSILNPFKWTIYVRCKEKTGRKRCIIPKPYDPCRDPNEEEPPLESTATAYSYNKPGDYNGAEITFCPQFFRKSTLDEVTRFGAILPAPYKLDIKQYENTGETFLHELMHLHVASDSQDDRPNPQPDDLTVNWQSEKGWVWSGAYGGQVARFLAKYDTSVDPFGFDVGFYTQRNADNLVFFCLGHWVQSKLGEYPYLPLVENALTRTPRDNKEHTIFPPSQLMAFDIDENGIATQNRPPWCSGLQTLDVKPTGDNVVNVDRLRPLSAYSQNYRDMYEKAINMLMEYAETPESEAHKPQCRPSDSLTAHETDIRFVVNKLCTNKAYWDKQIVPAISMGDGVNKALGANEYIEIHDGKDRLWASMGFAGGGCTGNFKWVSGNSDSENVDECKGYFEPLVTSCRHENLETYGGSMNYNCREAKIIVAPASEGDPTSPPAGGDIKCEDFDFDPSLFDEDTYKGSCKCWYTSNPKATDIFKKPKRFNKCSDIDVRLIPIQGV